MADRFCPRCNAEVEVTDGFCLLGHPVRLAAPMDSLKELRAEVDRAFEDAKVQVSAMLARSEPAHPGPQSTAPNSPPPPPPPSVFTNLQWPTVELAEDPLADFAPAPRMDWGPDKASLLKRLG